MEKVNFLLKCGSVLENLLILNTLHVLIEILKFVFYRCRNRFPNGTIEYNSTLALKWRFKSKVLSQNAENKNT